MSAKLIISTILLLALASSVQMQEQSIPIQQGAVTDQLRQLPFGGSLLNLPNQISNNIPRIPFLSSLQGNNQGGILSTIRDLPARGLQMISSVFGGIRNMLPGLGRNSNPLNGMSLPNMPSMPDMPNAPSMPNLPNLPNLSNLPMGDRLQQGAQTLSNAVSSLTDGIRGAVPRA